MATQNIPSEIVSGGGGGGGGSGGSRDTVDGSGASVVGTDTDTGNAMSLAVPAGIEDGDLILIFVATLNATVTTPTGFTVEVDRDNSTNERNYIFSKIASGEAGSWTVNTTGVGCVGAVIVLDTVNTVLEQMHYNAFTTPPMYTPGGEFVLLGCSVNFNSGATQTATMNGLDGLNGLTSVEVALGGSQALAIHGYDATYRGPIFQARMDVGWSIGRTYAVRLGVS